jgi:hypothetical protein
MNKCRTCAHWIAGPKASDDMRDCRAHSPHVTLFPVQALQGQGLTPVTYHPVTIGDHSCGEHSEIASQLIQTVMMMWGQRTLHDIVRTLSAEWKLGQDDVLAVNHDTGVLTRTPTAEEFERLLAAAKGESGQVDLNALRDDPRN